MGALNLSANVIKGRGLPKHGRDGGGGSTIKAISTSDDLSMGGDCRNGRQGGGGTETNYFLEMR